MSIFNGNSLFLSKKSKTMPIVKLPKNVKQSLQIDRAFENGIFKIEPKEKMAVYDRCYIFEDINYINKKCRRAEIIFNGSDVLVKFDRCRI